MASWFSELPDDARLWIYAADRPLSAAEQAEVTSALDSFLASWTSHGRRVDGGAAVAHDRFLLIAGLIPGGDLSGCGIDASVHALDEAAERLGFSWMPLLNVFFRADDGTVEALPRSAFRSLVRNGEVTSETPVFDLTIGTVGELRQGLFERPAGEAWHARAFRIGAPAS